MLGLTQGNPVSSGAILSYFRLDFSSYTGLAKEMKGSLPLIGRIFMNIGDEASRLAFLAPRHAAGNHAIIALLDHLAWESGNRGAYRFLAEMDEDDEAFECFRMAGFSVYTRQQIWKIPLEPGLQTELEGEWQPLQSFDVHDVQNLNHAIVPPLVQGAEGLDKRPIRGFVYRINGELLAFVEVISGPSGVYLIPVFHPNLQEPRQVLSAMISKVNGQNGKKIYLAIRDYQSWLQSALEDLNGKSSSRKVLMVKHLVHHQKVAALNPIRKVLEAHGTEPTAPIAQHMRRKK